jgi:formate-dependent nitrite reductase membrane component NrfD
MAPVSRNRRRLHAVLRAAIEGAFIVFLFYSNLLMGEFERGNQQGKSLANALFDVFTATNFVIAMVSAVIGYVVFEYLRKRL